MSDSTGRRPIARTLTAALIGVLVVAVLTWFAVRELDRNHTSTLTAVFQDSSPLTSGNEVRMNGAVVGKISAIDLVDGKSHVEMTVDRSVMPLHEGTSVRIEPVSLLGERFVALRPGPPSAPVLPEPVTLDLAHTSAAVDLDQLLNTLHDPTSAALAAVVTTLGEGLEGNGDTTAKALRGLAPTFQEVDKISNLLDKHNQLLDHFIVQVQRNLDQFAPPMDSLVDGATQTLGAVAANRQALNDTLVQAPPTLASARSTLAQLGDTADNTTGVLRDIRPITGDLREVSHELRDFSEAAAPALDSLPDVMHRLNRMLDDARPLVKDLVPMSKDLASGSDSLNAVAGQLMRHPRGQTSQLEHAMSAAANWAMSIRDYDGVSHIFRAELTLEPTTLGMEGAAALPAVGDQPPFNPVPYDPRGQSGHPGTPGLPQVPPLPPLDEQVGPDKGNPPNYYGQRRDHVKDGNGNGASGLTPEQEGNLYSRLLGGGN